MAEEIKHVLDEAIDGDKKIILISANELKEFAASLANDSATQAAQEAVKVYQEEKMKDWKSRKDRRFHNTDLLLRNYTMLKKNVEDAVYTKSQLEAEQDEAEEILELMDSRSDSDLTIESIKQSKIRTAIIMAHIDQMLDVFKAYCEESPDPLMQRRYNVLMDMYIGEYKEETGEYITLTVPEIADKYSISKESVYGDLKIAKERVSSLIFGIEGIPKR